MWVARPWKSGNAMITHKCVTVHYHIMYIFISHHDDGAYPKSGDDGNGTSRAILGVVELGKHVSHLIRLEPIMVPGIIN